MLYEVITDLLEARAEEVGRMIEWLEPTAPAAETAEAEEGAANNDGTLNGEVIVLTGKMEHPRSHYEAVITSYSIHYTKLYDLLETVGRTAGNTAACCDVYRASVSIPSRPCPSVPKLILKLPKPSRSAKVSKRFSPTTRTSIQHRKRLPIICLMRSTTAVALSTCLSPRNNFV